MLNKQERQSQPQESLLPPRMPTYGQELGDLIRAVYEDRTYSPSERAQTLGLIWERISNQQSKLKGPILISTISHRIAKLSREDPEITKASHVQKLMNELAQEATRQSRRFEPQALANTAWAFATLGIKNDQLFGALAQEAAKQISRFDQHALCNTAWAFAVDYPQLVSSVARRYLLEQGSLNAMDWLQCYQALLAAGTIAPSESFPRYQPIVEGYQPESQNSFERSVEGTLREVLKGTHRSISQGPVIAGVATDLLVLIGNRRIIIECDGDKFHLSAGPDGGEPLGCDRLQDRLFKVFGYEVVHIRDSEWASHDHAWLLRKKLGL